MKTALAFPASAIESLRFADLHRQRGWRVVGAASVPPDGMDSFYDCWASLPFVYDPQFEAALSELIHRENVTKIFSSHEVVKRVLLKLLPAKFPDLELETHEPAPTGSSFAKLCLESFRIYQRLTSDLDAKGHISATEHYAVLERAMNIRGESGINKLSHRLAVMGAAPAGDVVEIGVLSGRSAFVLGWSARRHQIGAVLCIDPWASAQAMQYDAPDLLRRTSSELDFNQFYEEFLINLLPAFHCELNYIRDGAANVRDVFRPGITVGPTEFGTTRYRGQIAVLHIDGNHDYEVVSQDIFKWWELVLPGGWLIVDDYVWPFGDGPKRAADELIARDPGAFQRIFATDGAIFLQRHT